MKKILGPGSLELVDSLGNDLSVVNAARVSFDSRSDELADKDRKLLKYLAKHEHTSPFRAVVLQFKVEAPRVVARQFWKHIVGSDYSFKDTQWNEASGRYIEFKDEFYVPQTFHKQSDDNKQASAEPLRSSDQSWAHHHFNSALDVAYDHYQTLLNLGVAKEEARLVLPEAIKTSWVWTASLQAVYHFVRLRDKPDAQRAIREYAEAMAELALTVAPNAWRALVDHG